AGRTPTGNRSCLLYDMLLHLAPSPVTRLHRAIALRYATGPRPAMTELDRLAGLLDGYHMYHASRADLLRPLGHPPRPPAGARRRARPPPPGADGHPGRASRTPPAPLGFPS